MDMFVSPSPSTRPSSRSTPSIPIRSGFRVQGSGCRVQGSGFRVQGSGFRVQGSGFRVHGSGFRVPDLRLRLKSNDPMDMFVSLTQSFGSALVKINPSTQPG